jgi:pimeloyl-ACP methyl ester carboxylesterase
VREIDQLSSVLPGVKVPTLLLADSRDRLVPVETARRLERAIPEARLELIRGPGHDLPRRAPGRVADAITGFLAAMDAGRGGDEQEPG